MTRVNKTDSSGQQELDEATRQKIQTGLFNWGRGDWREQQIDALGDAELITTTANTYRDWMIWKGMWSANEQPTQDELVNKMFSRLELTATQPMGDYRHGGPSFGQSMKHVGQFGLDVAEGITNTPIDIANLGITAMNYSPTLPQNLVKMLGANIDIPHIPNWRWAEGVILGPEKHPHGLGRFVGGVAGPAVWFKVAKWGTKVMGGVTNAATKWWKGGAAEGVGAEARVAKGAEGAAGGDAAEHAGAKLVDKSAPDTTTAKTSVIIERNSPNVDGATHLKAANGDDIALTVENGVAKIDILFMQHLKHPELIRAAVAEAQRQGASKLTLNSGFLVGQNSTPMMEAFLSSGKKFFGQAFRKLPDGTYEVDLSHLLRTQK